MSSVEGATAIDDWPGAERELGEATDGIDNEAA
jgi:hypothetical protein